MNLIIWRLNNGADDDAIDLRCSRSPDARADGLLYSAVSPPTHETMLCRSRNAWTKALVHRRSDTRVDPEPLRRLSDQMALLGDLRDRVPIELLSEPNAAQQGLLASKLGKWRS